MNLSGTVRNEWDSVLRGNVVQGITNKSGVPVVVPSEYGTIRILYKSDLNKDYVDDWEAGTGEGVAQREELPELVVAGYASPQVIDKENHLITREAMAADLPRFLAHPHYRNANIVHTNIQVGEVLPEWTHPETGKEFKTKVDEIGLFCIVRIRTDPFRPGIVDQVISDIEQGKLRAFSISGDAPYESRQHQCNDGSCFWVINKIEFYEITICQEGINQDAGYAILSKAAHCKDGTCPIDLPGRVTATTIRTILRRHVHKTASSFEAPEPPKALESPTAGESMQGGNASADVGEVAKHEDSRGSTAHHGKGAPSLPEQPATAKELRVDAKEVFKGIDRMWHPQFEEEWEAVSHGRHIPDMEEMLDRWKANPNGGVSPDDDVAKHEDSQGSTEHHQGVGAANKPPSKSLPAGYKEVGSSIYVRDPEGNLVKRKNLKPAGQRSQPRRTHGGQEIQNIDDDEGDDEHDRAVEFLEEHGHAYLGDAELSRAADLVLAEGNINLTLRSSNGQTSSTLYSADQTHEATRLALAHVRKKGAQIGSQAVHPEMRANNQGDAPNRTRAQQQYTESGEAAGINHMEKQQSAPEIGGFHMGDHGAQPGPHTKSRTGVVSDQRFDEVQAPTGLDDLDKHKDSQGSVKHHRKGAQRDARKKRDDQARQRWSSASVEDLEDHYKKGFGSRYWREAGAGVAGWSGLRLNRLAEEHGVPLMVEEGGRAYYRKLGDVFDDLKAASGSGESKATSPLPQIVGGQGQVFDQEMVQADQGRCAHGCDLTIDDMKDMLRTGELVQPEKDDKKEKKPKENGGEQENKLVPGHGHTRGDDEYYLHKGLLSRAVRDSDTCVICVVQNPALQPHLMLMGRRDDEEKYKGLTLFPGGHVQEGESLARAAERELLEETGVEATATRMLGPDAEQEKVFFVLLEQTGGDPRDTDEMTDVHYENPKKVTTLTSNRAIVDTILGGALSKHDKDPGHLHPPDFEKMYKHQSAKDHSHSDSFVWEESVGMRKAPQDDDQVIGSDIEPRTKEGEEAIEGEDKVASPLELADMGAAMTSAPDALVRPTDDLTVTRKAASCPACQAEGYFSKALDDRVWRVTAGEELRLMTRFALASLQKGVLNTSSNWIAVASNRGPQGIIHKGWAVSIPTLVSQVGKHALDVGVTGLWGQGYGIRTRLDRFHPVNGQDAYNALEDALARLIAVRDEISDMDTMVRDLHTEVVSTLLQLMTDYQVREDLGGFNPLQDPFSSEGTRDKAEERAEAAPTPPATAEEVPQPEPGRPGEDESEFNIDGIIEQMEGIFQNSVVTKGYNVGWYGAAQRMLARAGGQVRKLEGTSDLPEDVKIALGAIVEDIDLLENQLGVTQEMEKAGTLHEEYAGDTELEIMAEVSKETAEDVVEADALLETVEPLNKDSGEPKEELDDAEQQVHPTNVSVMVGAPDYTAKQENKFVDLRNGGDVLATMEDPDEDDIVVNEDLIRNLLREGYSRGDLHVVED